MQIDQTIQRPGAENRIGRWPAEGTVSERCTQSSLDLHLAGSRKARPPTDRTLLDMTRSLLVGAAIVAALAPTIVARGAPVPSGARAIPVFRPALARAENAVRPAAQDHFRVPFDVDVRAKPLAQTDKEAPFYSYTWQPRPRYTWYAPAWYRSACYANNLFGVPPLSPATPIGVADPAANISIGSLVDSRSRNLFSLKPSHKPGIAPSSNNLAALSPASSFQYEFQTPCGTANSFGF